MISKNKKILAVSILTFIVLVSLTIYVIHIQFDKYENRIKYYSEMNMLRKAVREQLYNYYDTNRSYPEKLTDITIPFQQTDKAARRMMDNLKYTTDGNCYDIICSVFYKTYKDRACNGKMIYIEIYENDQLHQRWEYSNGDSNTFSGKQKEYKNDKLIYETIYKDDKIISKKEF